MPPGESGRPARQARWRPIVTLHLLQYKKSHRLAWRSRFRRGFQSGMELVTSPIPKGTVSVVLVACIEWGKVTAETDIDRCLNRTPAVSFQGPATIRGGHLHITVVYVDHVHTLTKNTQREWITVSNRREVVVSGIQHQRWYRERRGLTENRCVRSTIKYRMNCCIVANTSNPNTLRNLITNLA